MNIEYELECRQILLESYLQAKIPVDLVYDNTREIHGILTDVNSSYVLIENITVEPTKVVKIYLKDIVAIVWEQR